MVKLYVNLPKIDVANFPFNSLEVLQCGHEVLPTTISQHQLEQRVQPSDMEIQSSAEALLKERTSSGGLSDTGSGKELIGSSARLISLLANTMRVYVSVLEVVYRYEGDGERGTHTLLMAAGDYDWRRVLFYGAAPQIRGLEKLDHTANVAESQEYYILYVLLSVILLSLLGVGYFFQLRQHVLLGDSFSPLGITILQDSPLGQVVGSDLAFLAFTILLLYVMWQLTAKQAAADAEYNLQQSSSALAKNRERAERNEHKENRNARRRSDAQQERARTYDKMLGAGFGLYDLGSPAASRAMRGAGGTVGLRRQSSTEASSVRHQAEEAMVNSPRGTRLRPGQAVVYKCAPATVIAVHPDEAGADYTVRLASDGSEVHTTTEHLRKRKAVAAGDAAGSPGKKKARTLAKASKRA